MTDHPGLRTPGAAIRGARDAQGLSLADLSERTKIPPPVLTALEADEYHKISGALYIKSFLRTCATELGLDAEEILGLYAGVSGAEPAAGGGADTIWREEEVQISRVGLPWRGISVAVLAVLLVGTGLIALVRGCGDGDQVPEAGGRPVATSPALPATGADIVVADDTAGSRGMAAGARDVADSGATDSLVDQIAAEALAASLATDGEPVAARTDRTDTLAGAWMAGHDGAADATPRSAPVEPETADQALAGGGGQRDRLPPVGGPNLVFAGGRTMPLVLRVIMAEPQEILVQIDSVPDFVAARWPAGGQPVPQLPVTGVDAGRVYRSRRDLVVYWGGVDHLTLRLERPDRVEVSLNGRARDVGMLPPGGEILLDADHAREDDGPGGRRDGN